MFQSPDSRKNTFGNARKSITPENVPEESEEWVCNSLAAANGNEREILRCFLWRTLSIELEETWFATAGKPN